MQAIWIKSLGAAVLGIEVLMSPAAWAGQVDNADVVVYTLRAGKW